MNKYLWPLAAAFLIAGVAGTANAHQRCTAANNLAWLPFVACDTSDDRGARRSFERKVKDDRDRGGGNNPGGEDPDNPGKGKHKGKGKGHEKGKGKGHEKHH